MVNTASLDLFSPNRGATKTGFLVQTVFWLKFPLERLALIVRTCFPNFQPKKLQVFQRILVWCAWSCTFFLALYWCQIKTSVSTNWRGGKTKKNDEKVAKCRKSTWLASAMIPTGVWLADFHRETLPRKRANESKFRLCEVGVWVLVWWKAPFFNPSCWIVGRANIGICGQNRAAALDKCQYLDDFGRGERKSDFRKCASTQPEEYVCCRSEGNPARSGVSQLACKLFV